MKTKNKLIITAMAILFAFAFITCDNGDDKKPVVCTCPEGTTHEPNEKCCEGTDCNCKIAEPAVREFTNIALFETYKATIKDNRTACGSADLEHVKVGEDENAKDIVTIIQEAIVGAFNDAPSGPAGAGHKNMFRAVFGTNGGVTIIVDNPVTAYKVKAPNGNTIYFHINHLNSLSAADLQTAITAAVRAMDPTGPELPYEAE